MYQFFVKEEQIQGNLITIEGSDVNHMKNVLRMKVGEELSVSNGRDGKEYRCEIQEFQEEKILCSLRFVKEENMELPVQITLFQGLPKADKMEWIIQKAVELGAFEIVPVAAKRCVVKLDDKKAAAKITRWQGISEAAAKQSKRKVIPKVSSPMSLKEAIQKAEEMDVRLIPYELAEGMDGTRKLIEGVCPGQSVALFIGPEGGFEVSEIEYAKEHGVLPITLGKRILRTETAGMTVLSWLMYHLEEKELECHKTQ